MDYLIIVAGGKGLRMGSDVPKQFLPVKGMPVLMRTISRFHECNPSMQIILVLPHHQQQYWHDLCSQYAFDIAHTVVDGGDTRFASSRNGLAAIPDDATGTVGIHDGVRPFVAAEVISRCYDAARTHGAAIPVMPVTDTLRHIARLRPAPTQPCRDECADAASVLEAMGCSVEMVEGNRENIKITTPFDLKIAETLC